MNKHVEEGLYLMKRFKISVLFPVLFIMMAGICGCGKQTESWAYSHAPDEQIISFANDGKAVYKGVDYTYNKDDSFYTLTDKQGNTLKLRYAMDGDNMILYETSVYKRDMEEPGSGIAGKWVHENGRNMFRFTKDGQFDEDGYFYGHYNVKENEGTIKLMYSDPLQDCIMYYSLDGDELTIEYPWPMVHVGENNNEKGQTTIPANDGK